MGGAGAAGGVEVAVGLGGGKSLIPKMNGEGKGIAEGGGELLGAAGLGAEVAGEVEGIAEDDGGAVEFAEEAAEGFEILAGIFADEGEHGLGGKAELIRDGDADAASAEIEAEEARRHPSCYREPAARGASYNESGYSRIEKCAEGEGFLILLRRFLFLMALVALAAAGAAGYVLLAPAGPKTTTFVEIAPGMPTSEIAAQLEEHGIIRSRYGFMALNLLRGGPLEAGDYRFRHPATMAEVWNRLHRGDVYTLTVTIPEGSNIFDIGARVQAAGLGTKGAFVEAAREDTALVRSIDPKAPSVEGYLFPDTYHFDPHATPEQMMAEMVHQFVESAQSIGLTSDYHRVVTLASLVEKETPIAAEKPLVASVFENRLRMNMPLMTDPSVIYAALLQGRYRGAIYESDLQSRSSYNTYQHTGLPPGPICNPGLNSLEAAMHPAHTDYLYFVAASADPSGHSRFSATLQQHAKDVQAYRRALREAARH